MSRKELIKKIIVTLIVGASFILAFSPVVAAQTPKTVLPATSQNCKTWEPYKTILDAYDRRGKESEQLIADKQQAKEGYALLSRNEQYDVIACSIKSGRFHLFMAPYMIRYLIEVVIGLAGIVSTLFIVIGAYQYLIGSVTDNKQKGKETIKNALIGLVITLLAWIIVNILQVALTGA